MAFGNRVENTINSPAVIHSLILGSTGDKLTPGDVFIGYPLVSSASDLCLKVLHVACCWSDVSDSV